MKVVLDTDRCQGHALCTITAPDVFLLDEDDGYARIAREFETELPADLHEAVREAADLCPERAISLLDN